MALHNALKKNWTEKCQTENNFILGLVKAVLGLILPCVGSNGLYRLFQKPRKLDHYYENSLRAREVIYDADGWPVHPDSKQRNVRLVSL